MVRPYAVKWLKGKRKRGAASGAAAAEDAEEEHAEHMEDQEAEEKKRRGEEQAASAASLPDDTSGVEEGPLQTMPRLPIAVTQDQRPHVEYVEDQEVEEKKRRGEEQAASAASLPDDRSGVEEGPLEMLPGLPIAATQDQRSKQGVIFILEKASLRVGRVGKKEHILTADDDANYLKNKGENPSNFRPDIVHQAMLAILDSPLNKAGRLQALYVKTDDGELIDVKPYVRLPRTFKRFCGLMYQLKMQKSIHATGKREKLFRMIKNPVTKHLPVNSRKIGFSYSSEKLVRLQDYIPAVGDDVTLVFVVGAMAHGKIDSDYMDDLISVSNYPLSAACCISRICNVLEQRWNVL